MAQSPKVKQLIPEDFKEQGGWIAKLITPLNSFMRSVSDALNNRLTISENFAGEIKTVVIAGDSPKIAWDITEKPTVGIIGKIERVDGSTDIPPAAFSLVWRFGQDNKIIIDDIVGLDDSNSIQYRVTILFLVK